MEKFGKPKKCQSFKTQRLYIEFVSEKLSAQKNERE